MALSIAEPTENVDTSEQNPLLTSDGDEREVLCPQAVKVARFALRSWGQELPSRPAPEGSVVVCITIDLGVQTQVHVTCPTELAWEFTEFRHDRQFKLLLTPEGLAITHVWCSFVPDCYIECRRDAE